MVELWCKIPDFPDYSISNFGRARNDDTDRLLTQCVNRAGVAYIGPSRNGKQYSRAVTPLVANAFLPPIEPPYRPDIFDTAINLDGNRTNNHVDNLMWRPLWFAVKYARQFHESKIDRDTLVVIMETGERLTSWEATLKYGLIHREIIRAARTQRLENKQVWPTWQTFQLSFLTHTITHSNRGL